MGKEKIEENIRKSDAPEAYIQELERRLVETETNLKALVSEQIDAVITAGGTTPLLLFQAQKALHESKTQLERRVAERTAELQQAKERLEQELAKRLKLQEHLEFQAMLLEHVHDAIFSVDTDYRLTSWNRAAEQLYGWTADEVIGQPIGEVILDDTRLARYQLLMDPTRNFIHTVLAHQAKDGQPLVVEASTIAIRDAHGKITGYVTAHRDITEEKLAQEELQRSEERFRNIVHISPDSIYVHVDEKFAFVNPAMLHLLGAQQPEELLGKTILDFIHPDDQAPVRERISSIHASRKTVPMREERFIRLDGSIVEVEVVAAPVFFEGKPGVLVIVRDISERKRNEAAIAEDLQATRLLHTLAARPVSEDNLEILYQEIVSTAMALSHADAGTFQILDENKHELLLLATQGLNQQMTEHFDRVDAGSNTSYGIALATGERTFFDFDEPNGHDPDGSLRLHLEAGFRSAQSTPLIARSGHPIGMITTHWHKHRRPTKSERRYLDLLARQAADLIERVGAEYALRESENRFRVMADGTPVMIWVTDPEGRIEFLNKAYESYFGVTLEDVRDKGWQPLVHPEDQANYVDEFFYCLRLQQPFRAQARVHRYDEQWHWIDSYGQPRFSDSGEFLGMAGSSIDISDQKQAEADLKESEELFRVALANTPITVFTCDRDLRYTWVYNPHPASPVQDMVGKRDDEYLDAETARALMAAKGAVIKSGRTTRQEFCIPMNGADYFFDATLEPLRDEKGTITGLTVAAMDVTELRKLEEREIENRAQAEVQRLLMRHRELERMQISRDLHDGPLQGLIAINIALSQALQTEIEEEERLRKLTQAQQVILSGIHDLREICNDLRPPALAPLGLAKAIQSHLRSFQERFPEINFHSQLANDKQVLQSEVRNALFRIYQELLLNACKHSQASEVRIGLQIGETGVTLEIEDDGIGFVKPANWLELGKAGHLGLIGVRERVDLINGKLEIETEPGAGTLMRVMVPIS